MYQHYQQLFQTLIQVLDVPWRVKLLLPAIAALPILLVYYATFDITFVVVPKPLRPLMGQSIDLGNYKEYRDIYSDNKLSREITIIVIFCNYQGCCIISI